MQIDIQDYSLVQAIRSCVVDGTTLLALGNEQGLQVGILQPASALVACQTASFPEIQAACLQRGAVAPCRLCWLS